MTDTPGTRPELLRTSREWKSSLIDVGGTNRLLHFKKTTATLDLDAAPTAAVLKLLTGATVRLAELFPEAVAFAKAQKACAALFRKQREAVEEYGVSVTYLAVCFATWNPEANQQLVADEVNELGDKATVRRSGAVPNAPVLLRPAQLERKRATQDSWEITLVDDFQANGVLLHVVDFDAERLDDEEIVQTADGIETATDAISLQAAIDEVADKVERDCADIAGFHVDTSLVIGSFSYQKQPMVNDVQDVDALGSSDLVAALAGDLAAAERVRATASSIEIDESTPDYQPVDSEYLVLDADASQSYVVNAALAGRNLVVQGPPGTGKSQTIANMIAALVASGKHVLFVAQKRAAITAVLDRLDNVGLSHALLDLFAADGSRRFVAEQIRNALERQQQIANPDVSALHFQLTQARDRLVKYNDALYRPEHGWRTSIHQLRVDSAAIPAPAHTGYRLPAAVFAEWQPTDLDRHAAALEELSGLGALAPDWSTAPGWRADALDGADDLARRREQAIRLQTVTLPTLLQQLNVQAHTAGFPQPGNWDDARALAQIHEAAAQTEAISPELLAAADLEAMLAAVSKEDRKSLPKFGWGERRRARKHADQLLSAVARAERADVLRRAHWTRQVWRGAQPPRPAANVADTIDLLLETQQQISDLDRAAQGLHLTDQPLLALPGAVAQLAADPRGAQKIRASDLETSLRAAGVGGVVDMLRAHFASGKELGATAEQVLRWVAIRSVLESAELTSRDVAGIRGADLDQATAQFRSADVTHLKANAARVRRRAAEHLKLAFDRYPEQHMDIKKEVTRKRNFRPVRRLLQDDPELLLATKPVWAMSPLQVSRLLPAQPVFDVVIFDEASQVKPADAIPALIRGRQAVVAGDSRQLPPTEFFTKLLEDEEEDEPDDSVDIAEQTGAEPAEPRRVGASLTRDAESILFAMDRLLAGQSRSLEWHYRSRDERLIAVSNQHVYAGTLTTFPAADATDTIRHVQVENSPGIGGGTNSPDLEVKKVVELVREHVMSRPDESIGVIAFGIKHEDRIEAALDQAMREDPAFEQAVNSQDREPLFVKAIERVQGDERDAIILSVGYGNGSDGKMRRYWGPLLQEGGDRRLNVAISRAKKRMTLVTSFSRDDVPADGHPSAGYRLMYHFLRFMSSAGKDLTDGPSSAYPLNAFELDIKTRLEQAGLALDCQVGVGGYRLDFAVRHPQYPGRHVLAIEADGASYHSGHTARERDRLRQTLLEDRGWRFHRIWSTDWFNNADAEIARTVTAYQAALAADTSHAPASTSDADTWNAGTLTRKLSRPRIPRYSTITDYTQSQLVDIVRYVRSDEILRSAEEEQRLVLAELGFSKLGSRIAAAIASAQQALDRAPARR